MACLSLRDKMREFSEEGRKAREVEQALLGNPYWRVMVSLPEPRRWEGMARCKTEADALRMAEQYRQGGYGLKPDEVKVVEVKCS